jgi:hypothetical protein
MAMIVVVMVVGALVAAMIALGEAIESEPHGKSLMYR